MRTGLVYLIAVGTAVLALMLGFPEWFRFGASGVEETGNGGDRPPPPVVVVEIRRQPFVDTLEALGTVIANESVSITANRADHIARIHFQDGQKVSQGDLLVELRAEEERALLAEATAVRDDHKVNFERQEELFQKNMTSAQEFEATKAALAGAEARVLSLSASIRDRQVRAPFGGLLGLRRVSVGAHVQPGTVITTLDDLSVVKLDFTIPEAWLPSVQPQMKILAESETWPDETFRGKVATIDTRLDPATRSATVRALLPNPQTRLRPGMLLKVRIERGERKVLQVPEEVLIPVGGDHFLFRVGSDDVARRVKVRVGRRRVGAVEIAQGLEPGDRVVVEGILRVRDGQPVSVVKTRDGRKL